MVCFTRATSELQIVYRRYQIHLLDELQDTTKSDVDYLSVAYHMYTLENILHCALSYTVYKYCGVRLNKQIALMSHVQL